MKLWRQQDRINKVVERFTVGNDYILDQRLVKYDCLASIAHARMLARQGILTATDTKKLAKSLKEIIVLSDEGKFKILPEQEDCHTAIENYLTKKLGTLGKKIHTGRSRNDQILVATRLYTRDKLQIISRELTKLQKLFLKIAKRYEFLPLPGYTHTRRAMPSSVGHWAASFLEELINDHELLVSVYRLIDQNPLGAAAGFGVDLALDRNFTTRLLNFRRLQLNSLYCVSSRGRVEGMVLSVLVKIMMTLARLANDLILFTAREFNFFILPESFVTGSSMMPHKKNPDIFEILRGNAHSVASFRNQVENICWDLISGYHRDTQLTKEPVMKSLELTQDGLRVMLLVLARTKPNRKVLMNAFGPEFFTVQAVNRLVKEGLPFREAYAKVKKDLSNVQADDPVKILKQTISPGAPGNLRLRDYKTSRPILN